MIIKGGNVGEVVIPEADADDADDEDGLSVPIALVPMYVEASVVKS